ncbi:MAG: PhzF family phenazine biosynthesis protein [Ignavibacteria bacterium]|nr:PhzF family phenazine biosynthesis protein [Ignavibacteria bacterium]
MNIYIVDAFTKTPFSGNPAGVCILDNEIDDGLMQNIANEVNLSETSFVLKQGDTFSIRWFTPTSEVPLCGHATLATAHILWEQQFVNKTLPIHFSTRKSGTLKINFKNEMIVMNFPQMFVTPNANNEIIQKVFDVQPNFIGCDETDYLVEVEKEDIVINIKPDFDLLKQLQKSVIITAKSNNKEYNFVSRMFAPNLGINEDPVTGSAHCYLAPYWGKKLNTNILTGLQASYRPGIVECVLLKNSRVLLKGTARTVIKGELNL